MNVRILGEAEQDLIDGFRFYEMQQEGLGDYVLDALFSDIDSLCLYAATHPLFFGHHRLLSKRFPYAVYYKMGQRPTAQVSWPSGSQPVLGGEALHP